MSEIIIDNQNKRKGLGRGLGSLLSDPSAQTPEPAIIKKEEKKVEVMQSKSAAPAVATEPASSQDKVWTLSIEKLKSGVYQPRKTFEKEALEELAKSIKEHGILQPLVARPAGSGQFEIVAGERRWRAAQLAGLHEVPVLIRNYNNQKTLELSLIENLQREDLNPIEEAEGYQRLQTEFTLTQEQIADRVGKERATVANSLRLLKLTPEVRALVQAGQLSQGHAKVILGITDIAQQKKLALYAVEQHLSVRRLESLAAESSQPKKTEGASHSEAVTQRLISGLSEELQKILGTKVTIDYKSGKGKMGIHFYSDDELTGIVEKLRGAQR